MGRRRGPELVETGNPTRHSRRESNGEYHHAEQLDEFVPAVKKAFGALGNNTEDAPPPMARALEEASAEGALDFKTRELISIAVAITPPVA